MDDLKHLVQQFIFEVDFDSEEKSYDFQREFAAFVNERLLALTDSVFNEFANDKHIRIGKLELDLGTVLYENYKEETIDKLDDLLRDKLRLLLAGFEVKSLDKNPIILSSQDSEIEILKYFCINGILPWMARRNYSETSIDKIITTLLAENPKALKQIIVETSQSNVSILRFVRQLKDELFWLVVMVYNEQQKNIEKEWFDEMLELYKAKRLFKSSLQEYKELIKLFLFSEVIQSKTINKSLLTNSFLRYLSLQLALPIAEVVFGFIESIVLSNSISKKSFQEIISSNAVSDKNESVLHLFINEAKVIGSLDLIENKLFDLENDDRRRGTSGSETKIKEEVKGEKREVRGSNLEHLVTENNLSLVSQQESSINSLTESNLSGISYLDQKLLVFVRELLSIVSVANAGLREVDIAKVEKLLKEILTNDARSIQLKKLVAESNFELSHFSSQELLDRFSGKFLETLLNKIFDITSSGYDKIKSAAKRQEIESFLKTGYWSAGFYVFIENIKSFEKIFLQLYSTSESSNHLKEIEKVVLASTSKLSVIKNYERYFSKAVLEKYFPKIYAFISDEYTNDDEEIKKSEVLEITSDVKEGNLGEDGEKDGTEKISILSISSTTLLTTIIEYYLQYDLLPANINESLGVIVDKLFELEPNKAFIFFNRLSEKQTYKLLLDVQEKTKTAYQYLLDKFNDEVNRLNDSMLSLQREIEESKKNTLKNVNKKDEKQILEFKKKLDSGEPIYISNSGLVILHSYLSVFFKKLELLDKKKFKDEYSSHKAAHLLQFIANKTTKMEEHELVINKILCGIELYEPLIREIEFSADEMDLCESLIEGVIQNWTILKKTSPDNFRASFLMREGRLKLEPDGWKLKVEEKGYDVLVEKLPWSISMIKLPWMKKMIHVEWK